MTLGRRRVDGLLVERTAGELAVLKQATSEVHALNETTSIVFDLCDGATSRSAMAVEIGLRTGLPGDEGIVDLALTSSSRRGRSRWKRTGRSSHGER